MTELESVNHSVTNFDPGKIWVIKIGSSLLTADGRGLSQAPVAGWVDEIVAVHKSGVQVVLVSSGAVAEGMSRLGMKTRPNQLHLLQAAAAVGQMGLIQLYESNFQRHGLHTAQILLTHDDLRSRERYINARSTLRNLLALGVIPVVNENDTVVTDEIRFGDNDTLAALVANLIEANTLLIMTDQRGLFTSDPGKSDSAELVVSKSVADNSLDAMAGGGGRIGRGGMVTKVSAARTAARSGANTIIASGREDFVITNLLAGKVSGTLLTADREVMVSRKQWLAALPARGTLVLDDGAVRVLTEDGRSLLAVGVKAVTGTFTRGEMVSCVNQAGKEIARGLVNYSHSETASIAGHRASAIESILGFVGDEELIHRDNMVVL
ncbi:MAG: glutamate 5-kinase [Pseudomonadales bacterium]